MNSLVAAGTGIAWLTSLFTTLFPRELIAPFLHLGEEFLTFPALSACGLLVVPESERFPLLAGGEAVAHSQHYLLPVE